MKTIGGRDITDTEEKLVSILSDFYKEGMSVSEMIQCAYEAQRHWKRDNGKPVTTNVNEKNK